MRKLILTVLLTSAAASGARAVLSSHDKVTSLWAVQPLSMDGGQEQWSKGDETMETSVAFRATNDSSDLYLLITPRGRDGRGLLSGSYRQDVALWFLGPDQKARTWELLVPYSRLDQLAPGTTQAQTIEPEYLTMQDTQVSTAPLPGAVSFHLQLDERKPIIEVRIALKNLPTQDGNTVSLDFTTTPVSPIVAAQIKNEKTMAPGAPNGGRHGGGRHHGGGQGLPQGATQAGPPGEMQVGASGETPDEVPGAPPLAPTVPDTLDLELSVKLASGPQ